MGSTKRTVAQLTPAHRSERLARAFDYPYPAPSGDYLFAGGTVEPLSDSTLLKNRSAVLAVGSNRSPKQLLRKFGRAEIIPVTRCVLTDFDVAYCAYLTHYGSVPATLVEAPGVRVTLSITWLDDAQLAHMHTTESVGPHTRFGALATSPQSADIDCPNELLTYVSARGLLQQNGQKIALNAIEATGRAATGAPAMTQPEALDMVHSRHGEGKLADWLLQLMDDDALRASINDDMKANAVASHLPGFTEVSLRP